MVCGRMSADLFSYIFLGFRTYSQMAMRMAIDLGLSDQDTIQIHLSDRERNRRRSAWASILQLHSAASYNR